MATRAEDLPAMRAQLAELEAERTRWLMEQQTRQSLKQTLKQQIKLSVHQLAQLKKPKAQTTGKTRMEELQSLQERALAIVKKNQQAATALTKQFKQLNTLKRPSEDAPEIQMPKRTARPVAPPLVNTQPHPTARSMHDCAGLYRKLTSDENAHLKTSLLFRISVRYLLQIGRPIPATLLLEKAQQCTGGSCALGPDDIRHFAQILSDFHYTGLIKGETNPASSIDQSNQRIWTPGSQVTAEPTLCLEEPELITTWLMAEKQAVEDACAGISSLGVTDSADSLDTAVRASYFATALLGKDPFCSALIDHVQAFPHCMSKAFERPAWRLPVTYQSLHEFSGFCLQMDKWFQSRFTDDSLDSHDHSSTSHKATFVNPTSSFSRPFAIEQDSIFKQVHTRSTSTKTNTTKNKQVDPMRIFCLFELNGTCNDENCVYLHQKDFEAPPVASISQDDSPEEVHTMLPAPEIQLLHNFAEHRSLVMKKWPLVGLTSSIAKRATAANENEDALRNLDKDVEDENFLVLDETDDTIRTDGTQSVGSLRYCDGDQPMVELSAESLEENVNTNIGDVNSWLLLAVNQLELDITWSDDVSQLSDKSFIYHLMMALWRFLDADASTNASIDDNLLKKSLSTLSRALEHEENAYNEVLWLLHLHLSQMLEQRDLEGELQIAEQAVMFIPMSHRLWLHYLSTSRFESIPTMETMYGRILVHLAAQFESVNEATDEEVTRASHLSVLVTAVLFNLCVKLFRAGKSKRVLEILGLLINTHPTSRSSAYFDVRILDQRELACITMTYAHILLFNEIPAHMATWATLSVDHPPNVKEFAYTIESFCLNLGQERTQGGDTLDQRKQALAVYDSMIEQWNYDESAFDIGNVIFTNWILLLSLSCEANHASGEHPLHGLSELRWSQIELLPFAAFTVARLFGEILDNRNKAIEFMLAVVGKVSQEHASEALYYYLCLHQYFQAKDRLLIEDFVCHQAVWVKLSSLFSEKGERLEADAEEIHEQTDPEAISTFLSDLIMIWMDKWRLVDGETKLLDLSDIYLLLNVIQLSSLLIGATEAIQLLQPILSSSKFDFLPIEWRHDVWKMRFMLEFTIIFQSLQQSLPHHAAINYDTELIALLRIYVDCMDAGSEQKRQVTTNVSKAVMRFDVQTAVRQCLSPCGSYSAVQSTQMELFHMVTRAVPRSELSSFFGNFSKPLKHIPEFSLMFADFATQDWEIRKVRAGLRKCAADRSATKMHPRVLAALASLELRQGHMKALAAMLERHIQEDPLVIGPWELLFGLEILCGDDAPPSSVERASNLAAEMCNLKLSIHVNAYGDDQVVNALHCMANDQVQEKIIFGNSTEKLTLHQFGLFRVPNAVLLCNQLRVLDLSANCLVELPRGMDRLHKLEILNLSENSIANFPTVIAKLVELKSLNLSHNNLRTLPKEGLMNLVKLEMLDVRANCIDHVSPLVLSGLKSLRILRLKDNKLSNDAIKSLEEDLPASSAIEVLEDDELMESTVTTADSVESESIEEGELRETIEAHEAEQIGATPNDLQADGMSDDATAQQISDLTATSENAMTAESIDESDDDEVEFVGYSRRQDRRSDLSNHVADTSRNDLQVAPYARMDQIAALARMKAYANETGMPLAQVRQCQPQLWQEYVKAHIPTHMYLGRCVLCQRANDGRNQRFNTMVLCPFCLQDTVDLLLPQQQQRNQSLSPVAETKEDA